MSLMKTFKIVGGMASHQW